jgi:hypothetical protein
LAFGALIAFAIGGTPSAQRPPISDAIKPFVSMDAPVVALVNARVVDGTGGPSSLVW